MADNLDVLDAASVLKTVATTEDAITFVHTPHQIVDNTVNIDITAQTVGPIDTTVSEIALPASLAGKYLTATAFAPNTVLPLAGLATPLTSGVTIKAAMGNVDQVGVGDVGINVAASMAYILEAGEAVFIEINDLQTVFVEIVGVGDSVSWIGA